MASTRPKWSYSMPPRVPEVESTVSERNVSDLNWRCSVKFSLGGSLVSYPPPYDAPSSPNDHTLHVTRFKSVQSGSKTIGSQSEREQTPKSTVESYSLERSDCVAGSKLPTSETARFRALCCRWLSCRHWSAGSWRLLAALTQVAALLPPFAVSRGWFALEWKQTSVVY